jgi:hypothetical protein
MWMNSRPIRGRAHVTLSEVDNMRASRWIMVALFAVSAVVVVEA